MPVQIGAKPANFSDPTGLLTECHRRIESFLGTLQAVADVLHRPPTEEVARALESALLYFRQAAPKHTADEEESLFPRLRRVPSAEVTVAFSKLRELEKEHRWATPLHAEVEELGMRYLSGVKLSSREIDRFHVAIRDLRSMYERHIRIEDDLVFPLASRLLTEQDKSAIAEEMAGRREIKFVGSDSRH